MPELIAGDLESQRDPEWPAVDQFGDTGAAHIEEILIDTPVGRPGDQNVSVEAEASQRRRVEVVPV